MDKLWDIPFFLPKNSKLHLSLLGVRSIFIQRINWNSGHEKYTELEKILKKLKAPETEFFAKGYEKCKNLSEILETKLTNLDDYACPKVQNLIFKDEEYDWRCSNYPFRHANTLHCAERKAFAYGTWTRCFFNKL